MREYSMIIAVDVPSMDSTLATCTIVHQPRMLKGRLTGSSVSRLCVTNACGLSFGSWFELPSCPVQSSSISSCWGLTGYKSVSGSSSSIANAAASGQGGGQASSQASAYSSGGTSQAFARALAQAQSSNGQASAFSNAIASIQNGRKMLLAV